MAEPWGEILYRAAAFIAGLVALMAALNSLYNFSEGEPNVPVAALELAAIIWLIGFFCRYVCDVSEVNHHSAQR